MQRWGFVAGLSLCSFAAIERADACGGLFHASSTSAIFPVVQSSQGIVLALDRETVTAIIHVEYQGTADEFAWVIPLPSLPLDVDVVPARTFDVIDTKTGPIFSVSPFSEGICLDEDFSDFPGDDVFADDEVVLAKPAEVLTRAAIGPYDSAVIRSTDPNEIRTWLDENGYLVDEQRIEALAPYLAKGDVLLAFKLSKDNDVGHIRPIRITMAGTELGIPLRLAAIAALADMELSVLVLSNEGRAIPKNYQHVTINFAKLNWLSYPSGANYRALVSQAADEASGNAFTTDYAGDASVFRAAFFSEMLLDRAALEATTNVAEFMLTVASQGLFMHRETMEIALKHLPDEAFTAIGVSREAYLAGAIVFIPWPELPFDPTSAVAEIWEQVVARSQELQALFDRYRYVTRMYTVLSPEEMTIDPELVFRPELPDVPRVHLASLIRECGVGGTSNTVDLRIELRDPDVVLELGDGTVDRSVLDSMPAALRVEQLYEDRLITDNSAVIEALAEKHNEHVGCGCSTTGGTASPLLLLLLLIRRRRWLALLLCTGCMSMNTFETARTTAPGTYTHSISLTSYVSPDREPVRPIPMPSYAVRFGVIEDLDFALQLGMPGHFRATAKYNPLRTTWFDASIAPSLWVGWMPHEIDGQDHQVLLGGDLPVILDLNFGPVTVVPFAGPGFAFSPSGGMAGVIVRTGLGLRFPLGDHVRLHPEFSTMIDPVRGEPIDYAAGFAISLGSNPHVL